MVGSLIESALVSIYVILAFSALLIIVNAGKVRYKGRRTGET